MGGLLAAASAVGTGWEARGQASEDQLQSALSGNPLTLELVCSGKLPVPVWTQ